MTACVGETKQQIGTISDKLQRLLDGYLDQDIDRNDYVEKKATLMSEKKSLEEKITDLEHTQSHRLEPMREWIKTASNLNLIAAADLIPKRDAVRQVFGSNLTLTNRFITGRATAPWFFLSDPSTFSSLERVWGVEPHSTDWKSVVIPIYDTRLLARLAQGRPAYFQNIIVP